MNAILQSKDAMHPTCSLDPYTLPDPIPITKRMVDKISTPSERREMIARDAYFRSQRRNFAPGHELDDWLAAEHDIDALCELIEPHPNWDLAERG
jgi:hypothetical protein